MILHCELWPLLDHRQRLWLLLSQLLALVIAVSTRGGIAAIIPFFAVLADPQVIDHSVVLSWLYQILGFDRQRQFVVALGVGFVGVDVFFVISGYLITQVLAQAGNAGVGTRLAKFYLRRARRIVPALLMMLLIAAAAALALLLPHDLVQFGKQLAASGRPSRTDSLLSVAVASLCLCIWAASTIWWPIFTCRHREPGNSSSAQ